MLLIDPAALFYNFYIRINMKIPCWSNYQNQSVFLGKSEWSISRLVELSKNFPVIEIPLDHLNVYFLYNEVSLREIVMHVKAVLESDLDFPIILDEDGGILDGKHRVMKAILNGESTIKAVRFEENPSPCRIDSKP